MVERRGRKDPGRILGLSYVHCCEERALLREARGHWLTDSILEDHKIRKKGGRETGRAPVRERGIYKVDASGHNGPSDLSHDDLALKCPEPVTIVKYLKGLPDYGPWDYEIKLK